MTPAGVSAKASRCARPLPPAMHGSVVYWLTGDLVVRVEECLG